VSCHGVGSLCRMGATTAGVGREGHSRYALSPTGSTPRRMPVRVTNDKAAASRTRLLHGHEAPVASRPRTKAGLSTISEGRVGGNMPISVHGASGVACDTRIMTVRPGLVLPPLDTYRLGSRHYPSSETYIGDAKMIVFCGECRNPFGQ